MLAKKHTGQLTDITLGGIYFVMLNKSVSFPAHLLNIRTAIYFHPENNGKNIKPELTVVVNSGKLFQQV